VLRRQLILGDTPDTDRVQASYTAGVLTLRIPVAEKATPCKITTAVPDADYAALTG
jgi:HSP20 family protein